jgi:acetyl-CoA/propionyl-CoA carboxylase biotin carboxyl carrier protein
VTEAMTAPGPVRPFDTVLVANRGEIAVRVIRTLRRLDIRSVAVFSDADEGAPHTIAADEAVRIGPAPAAESYLDPERLVAAALATGADAVHPGYGFLAENAAFARACAEASLVFVGPPPGAIETMGDKIRAKQQAERAGVPVVPGRHDADMDDDAVAAAVADIGLPALLKPAAGGGGKGMRVVRDLADLSAQVAAARREARASFGDDRLLVERYLDRPRHVEIQVVADSLGDIVHLGERECSLQRRHQKVVEESPSPALDPDLRERMGAAAVAVARGCGYVGAGTVEMILSPGAADGFCFLEMNTRLQVEHPVTELVTGLDLVEMQLRVAAGEPLSVRQEDVRWTGHAVEARIYAEDPARGFLPTGGRVLVLREPSGPHIRVDSGLSRGLLVGTDYDPMLAKVACWAPDRAGALARLDAALADTAILGVRTNVAFLRALLRDADVAAGRLDTHLVDRRLADLAGAAGDVPDDVLAAAALGRLVALEPPGPVVDPFAVPGGWRLGGPVWTTWRLQVTDGEPRVVRTRGRAADAVVVVGDGEPMTASARLAEATLRVRLGDREHSYDWGVEAGPGGDVVTWLGSGGGAWAVADVAPPVLRPGMGAGGHGSVRSPLPGTVTVLSVAVGDRVAAGTPLLVVEAMKMEHAVSAPVAGVVTAVHVAVGRRVAMDAPLVAFEPDHRHHEGSEDA